MKIAAKYFNHTFDLRFGEVEIANGVVVRTRELPVSESANAPYLLPGLCDIHTHGNSGLDFTFAPYDGWVAMARFLFQHGVTRFSAATLALGEEKLTKICETARRFYETAPEGCAKLAGITLEGPFLSYAKRGAQNEAHLVDPDYDLYARLQRASGGLIKIVCVAPELPGAMEFIRRVSKEAKVALAHTDCEKEAKVALAHTDCEYEQAAEAFESGVTHVTHLFNAMRPMHHRAPGPIPAASERESVTAELIADGVHVHPAMVRAAYRLFGEDRLCLISDAMAACGMADGEYELGEQKVFVQDGRATLAGGAIAGSTATLWDCMKNALSLGIPLVDVMRMAAANPRRVMGIALPVVQEGERADFALCDDGFNIRAVYA